MLNIDADSDKDVVDLRRLILAEDLYSVACSLVKNRNYGQALKCFENANHLWPNQRTYLQDLNNCRKFLGLVDEHIDADNRHQTTHEKFVSYDGCIEEFSLHQLLYKDCPAERITSSTDRNIKSPDDGLMDGESQPRSVYSVQVRHTFSRYRNRQSRFRRKRMNTQRISHNTNYG